MNKKKFLTIFTLFFVTLVFAQDYEPANFLKVVPIIDISTPNWAVKMYSNHPNVNEVDRLFKAYFKTRAFKKTIHTQNYKHWRWQVEPYIDDNGFIAIPSRAAKDQANSVVKNRYLQRNNAAENSGNWYAMGPFETFAQNSTTTKANHKNVYSIDQSLSNSNLLICGTEAGGVYKSTDKGSNWSLITKGEAFVGDNTAVRIHPTNPDIFFVSSNDRIYRSLDGGTSWAEVKYIDGSVYEFKFDPANSNNIFAVSNEGLFTSTDGGTTWSNPITDVCYDLDFHPTNSSIVYLLKKNSTAKRVELFRSNDGGTTWMLKDNGYFSPSDLANASPSGGKIGVTPASADLVYVCLIGAGKETDKGWIGVYKSIDKADTWTNPSGQDGAPYGAINSLVDEWNVSAYSSGTQQGFYNFDFEVSHNNAAKLWVGTIRLSESTDGGATWISIGAADSERLSEVHADIQDIEVIGNDIWVANDGGIHYSNDELMTHTIKIKGIQASHFWGFSTGWNEDVFIGGKYHTGTSAYYEGYGLGNAQHIGGVEEASGYVHPINSRKVYYRTHYNSSNTSVKTISTTLGGTTLSHASLPLYPNESYYTSRSSGIYFDPRYADHLFIGRDNFIYKSIDGGASFDILYTFPTGNIYEVEISREDPNIIYAVFKPDNAHCVIYKTTDGGTTWATITTPPSNSTSRLEISLNPADANEVWVATSGNNSNKVFQTTDGGMTWTNRTTSALNDESTKDILYQGGTNDVVYLATYNTVFYWNTATSDWIEYGFGLPAIAKSLRIKPFYRDAELRLGSGGRGAFGASMIEPNFTPVAQPITYKDKIYCTKDTVDFDCFSVLKHSGASWQWSFSPAPLFVSSTTVRNPRVVFGADGNYNVTLTVTDGNGASHSKTIVDMIEIEDRCGTETIAGKALSTTADGDYAQIDDSYIENVTHFTISAWIKPNGTQKAFSAIVSNGAYSADGVESIGLIYDYYGSKLWYKWGNNGGSWGSNSGMIIPSDEWSYVAMVVKPDSIILYLNDERHVTVAAINPIDINSLYVGKGHYSKYFKGLIDEVTIWERDLSKEEIRALRHRTKNEGMMANDPKLIGYYQFNTSYDGQILNKVGGRHAYLKGNSSITTSGAPVGGGEVQHLTLNGEGVYDFANVGAKLTFNNCTAIDGQMYITQINEQPHLPPNTNAHAGNYWIINQYGESVGFSPLDSIELTATDASFATGLSSTSNAYLHLRNEHSDAFEWETKASARNKTTNTFKFSQSNSIDGAMQIFMTNNGAAFAENDAISYCTPDTLPKKAVYLNGTGSANVIIPALNLNTNHLTISAWIKPEGIQKSNAGIVFTRGGSSVSGLNFKSNNELGYHWNGGQYGWPSGAIVPEDVWSHVVLVIEPTRATIYLNGKPYIKTGRSHALEAFDGVTLIGRDNNSSSRVFKGDIDEVVIWNRALGINEIRRHRHLTKEKMIGQMPSMKAYYQFNEPDGTTVFDKSGNQNHAELNGNSTRKTSTAPIGSGKSQRIVISGTGLHSTDSSGIRLTFPAAGTHPNGELIVTQINSVQSDQLPAHNQHVGYYWIINNYGQNQSFSALDQIQFKPPTLPNSGFNTTNEIMLYKRSENEHRDDQWTQMCNPSSISNGEFIFDNTCNMTEFSQLHLIEEAILPVELLFFDVSKTARNEAQLNWATATQKNFSHFELEHSINGIDFEKFETIYTDFSNSLERQDYSALHNNPIIGYNFYRLKMMDKDGSFEYTDVKAIVIENIITADSPIVFPNPISKNQSLNINIQALSNPHIYIYKSNGKLIRDFLLKKGENKISAHNLAVGTYFYSIQSKEKIYNGKIVVY